MNKSWNCQKHLITSCVSPSVVGKRTMTDRSPEVVWALTKKRSALKSRWMRKDWSHSPWSMNGKWNASGESNTIGVTVRKEKTEKGSRRTFVMSTKHSQKNGISKNKGKASQSSHGCSSMDIGRAPARAAKAINAQRAPTPAQKKACLIKLEKLSRSTNPQSKGKSE